MPSSFRRARTVAAVALATLAVTAPSAAAEACPVADASKPFLPWVDPANYVLAPGGDAESSGAWDLSGGAAVVEGNEPYYVGAADHASSLSLPAGGSATTEPMCVGLEHPTLRLFAKRESASSFGGLRIEALFTDAGGELRAWPMGTLLGSGRWAPTPPLPIVVNTLALVQSTEVAFRFTAVNGSRWSIDDVYVDPYRTN